MVVWELFKKKICIVHFYIQLIQIKANTFVSAIGVGCKIFSSKWMMQNLLSLVQNVQCIWQITGGTEELFPIKNYQSSLNYLPLHALTVWINK